MSPHHIFIFFFICLQDELAALTHDHIDIYYAIPEGGNAEIACPPSSASTRKFFCRVECKKNDIIIQTTEERHQDGRYSIEWRGRRGTSSGDVKVTISQVTTADNGQYRCGVGGASSESYKFIEIIVVDALLKGNRKTPIYERTGGNLTVACFFSFSSLFTVRKSFLCRDTCTDALIETADYTAQAGRYSIRYIKFPDGGSVYANISQLTTADSGTYTCGLKRIVKNLNWVFEVAVTDDSTTVKQNVTMSTSVPPSWKPKTPPTKPGAKSLETTEQPAALISEAQTEMENHTVMENVPEEDSPSPPGENIYSNTVGISLDRMETDRQNTSVIGADDQYTVPSHGNHLPVSGIKESVYESLDPATREQCYSTLSYRSKDAAGSSP
ncbi:uncharacterized protein LOC121517945 isoform X2 [Cheilinus undulatus]|uniref:uncharacterized protein LOC121517945 isoform X2 n=1 Tax=Cheilinus undulatus TaxID=241271 RepID=UPI001BD4F49C|nr:uncharacterized protein LOC121517945 isoform X2 [Cheilinus undulatus]